jgi:hypothetical protein
VSEHVKNGCDLGHAQFSFSLGREVTDEVVSEVAKRVDCLDGSVAEDNVEVRIINFLAFENSFGWTFFELLEWHNAGLLATHSKAELQRDLLDCSDVKL